MATVAATGTVTLVVSVAGFSSDGERAPVGRVRNCFQSVNFDSDVAPERVWDRANGDCPQFAFRTRPDDSLIVPYYLLPLIRAATAPALNSLLYVPTQVVRPARARVLPRRRGNRVGPPPRSRRLGGHGPSSLALYDGKCRRGGVGHARRPDGCHGGEMRLRLPVRRLSAFLGHMHHNQAPGHRVT